MKTNKVIAIDGTAASGKGTLARRLADHFNYAYLDTGKLYRYLGYQLVKENKDPADETLATEKAKSINLSQDELSNPELLSDQAGQAASKVGAIPEVRKILLNYQRDFSKNPPNQALGAVLDGRDIGTIVCPDADIKFYIDAEIEVRAQRRTKELQSIDFSVKYDAVLADMEERDLRDAKRSTSPMKPADDAILIDTSSLSQDDVLDKALTLIHERLGL